MNGLSTKLAWLKEDQGYCLKSYDASASEKRRAKVVLALIAVAEAAHDKTKTTPTDRDGFTYGATTLGEITTALLELEKAL